MFTRRPTLPFALSLAAVSTCLSGCKTPTITESVPSIARDYKPHMAQVLDNIAAFSLDPAGAWPSHLIIYKGAFETRQQWVGAVGTSTKLENTSYSTAHWDFTFLDDPYDIQRVRLLYQWQVGYITFDDLEHGWSQIRDRPVLDGAGKPVMNKEGSPAFVPLPLPITAATKRDWIVSGALSSAGRMSGTTGQTVPGIALKTVSVVDNEAAAQFSIAVLTAMANTRVKARFSDAAMPTP